MNELVRITPKGNQAVDAKQLYNELEINKDFSSWIKDNLKDFIEDEDYSKLYYDFKGLIMRHPLKGETDYQAHKINYVLTLNCAKKIAMLSRTKKGNEVRNYFLKVEEQFKQQLLLQQFQLPDFTKPAIAARAWADQCELKELAQEQKQLALVEKQEAEEKKEIAEQKQEVAETQKALADQTVVKRDEEISILEPKSKIYDELVESSDLYSMSETAKMLELVIDGKVYGRNNLMKLLKQEKILMANNEPYQQYVSSGYFERKNAEKGHIDKLIPVTFVTGKGLVWLVEYKPVLILKHSTK